jgi:hypothetical protein
MKTITVELFTLAELSEEAKTRAYNDYLNLGFGYSWQSEANETLKAFCKLFNVSLDRDGDYKSFYNGSEFKDLANLSGPRLLSYLWNNYGKEIFKPKQYWICQGTKNCVGIGAKKRESKIFITPWNCPLSGYHMDNYILAPLIEYMTGKKENWINGKLKIERVKFPMHTTFEDLLRDCIQEFNQAVNRDYEEAQSFEQFKETSEANEWTYTENGKFER